MPRKSSVNIPAIQVIRIIVFLFLGLLAFFVYARTADFLTRSPLFAVKDVVIDASIQFIDTAELKKLKGRNIFMVDLMKIQKRLQSQYPQIDQLRVMRELPDRIKVLARRRDALFQVPVKSKILLVDTLGMGMYYVSGPVDLPLVKTAATVKQLKSARDIITQFKARPHLQGFKIMFLDLSNPSKVELGLHPSWRVIMDQEGYETKMEVLDMLVNQKKVDIHTIKYVDLRFHEPVLGENPEDAGQEGAPNKNRDKGAVR